MKANLFEIAEFHEKPIFFFSYDSKWEIQNIQNYSDYIEISISSLSKL